MNRKIPFHDLVNILAKQQGCSPAEAEKFAKAFFDQLAGSLVEGETVKIKGFGTFEPTGNGEAPVAFTPAEEIADVVNAPFAMFEPEVIAETVTASKLAEIDEQAKEEVAPAEEPVEETIQKPVEEPVKEPVEEPKAEVVEEIVAPEPEVVTEEVPVQEAPAEEAVEEPEVAAEEVAAEEVATPPVVGAAEEPVAPAVVAAAVSEPVKEAEAKVTPTEEEEEEEEYVEEPQSTGPGFGMGFLIGLLVGLALSACAVYFALTLGYLSPSGDDANQEVMVHPVEEEAEVAALTETPATEPTSEEVAAAEIAGASAPTAQAPAAPVADTPEAPAPAAKPAEAAPAPVYDTVGPGYLITKMAQKHYGSKDFWVYIYEENKATLKNPNHQRPGQKVVIPPASKYGIDAKNPSSIEAAKKKASEILAKFPK